jgi:hypothetical protein
VIEKTWDLNKCRSFHETSKQRLTNVRLGEMLKTDILGADRYLEQLKHSKVKGYLFQQQNYVPKE